MFAHERSLVTKYRHKPFVLLGVNEDISIQGLQLCQEKHQLNWRSWWDGLGGPIAVEWKVSGLPALFLLDHKGMVRWNHVGPPDSELLEELIAKLVLEAESDGKKQAVLSKR